MVTIEDFSKEVECTYKNECYSVRDNGAVLRHSRHGKRPRPTDNQWTFGKLNEKTGYMEIVSERIHRIVAIAFHGEPPTKEHVVDHIDTNRQNNRPENLRWLTKLENVLKNPITVKKIIVICGSIEAFLENPQILRETDIDQNFAWMRAVSKEEGQASLQRLQNWAKNDAQPKGGTLGEWIFKSYVKPLEDRPIVSNINKIYDSEPEEFSNLFVSKTQGAAQRNWRTPSEFPCCPIEPSEKPIETYATNLKAGVVFSRNDYGDSLILDSAINEQSIIVMTENTSDSSVKPWAVAKVTYEDGLYIHESLGSFFEDIGAEKEFTIACGLEWTGGETFDDLVG